MGEGRDQTKVGGNDAGRAPAVPPGPRGRRPAAAARDQEARGMSASCDWIGGYPFEVATPDEVVSWFEGKGFLREKLVTVGGGSGNNEYVFRAPGGASERA